MKWFTWFSQHTYKKTLIKKYQLLRAKHTYYFLVFALQLQTFLNGYFFNLFCRKIKVRLKLQPRTKPAIVSKSFPLSKKVFLMLENQQKGSIYYGKCLKAP